jgi:hypothetical protein
MTIFKYFVDERDNKNCTKIKEGEKETGKGLTKNIV